LENYYRDGECYYNKYYIVAKCDVSGDETEAVYGNHEGSIKRSLATLQIYVRVVRDGTTKFDDINHQWIF